MARAFHVGVVSLRRGGIEAIVNRPFDARLRARYIAMGLARLGVRGTSGQHVAQMIAPRPGSARGRPSAPPRSPWF